MARPPGLLPLSVSSDGDQQTDDMRECAAPRSACQRRDHPNCVNSNRRGYRFAADPAQHAWQSARRDRLTRWCGAVLTSELWSARRASERPVVPSKNPPRGTRWRDSSPLLRRPLRGRESPSRGHSAPASAGSLAGDSASGKNPSMNPCGGTFAALLRRRGKVNRGQAGRWSGVAHARTAPCITVGGRPGSRTNILFLPTYRLSDDR